MLETFKKKPMIWWRYIVDKFFIWEHGEESLKVFIEQVNMFHSTIKFTAEYSKEEVKFLDVNIKLIDGELKTDLLVKPTDTHQFLDPTSCYPNHCKMGISYSQALRLNRICSDNETFDRRSNNLEKSLMERGYNEKMIRQMSEKKLLFNITCYPTFQNVRSIMEELHILLTPNKEHKKVIRKGFRNGTSLKDYLLRAKLFRPCEPCGKKTCLVCESTSTTTTFTTETCQETSKIQKGLLICDSEKALYLLKCKACGEVPYVGKAKTKFCYRFNNYKSKHRAFRKGNQKVPQKRFHAHYCLDGHSGADDWNFVIFEQCETHEELKERGHFW